MLSLRLLPRPLCLGFKFPNADGTRFPNAEIRLRVPKALAGEKKKWMTFAEKVTRFSFFTSATTAKNRLMTDNMPSLLISLESI